MRVQYTRIACARWAHGVRSLFTTIAVLVLSVKYRLVCISCVLGAVRARLLIVYYSVTTCVLLACHRLLRVYCMHMSCILLVYCPSTTCILLVDCRYATCILHVTTCYCYIYTTCCCILHVKTTKTVKVRGTGCPCRLSSLLLPCHVVDSKNVLPPLSWAVQSLKEYCMLCTCLRAETSFTSIDISTYEKYRNFRQLVCKIRPVPALVFFIYVVRSH